MAQKSFVDSNVLIYAHDLNAGAKRETAIQILEQLWLDDSGVLSTQVLKEFYSAVTRKLKMAKPAARGIVEMYSEWCGGETTPEDIRQAFRVEDESQISFWDSLIIVSAAKFGASCILTENMNHGQIIGGIELVNPFLEI
jgi:predicted nucleic acid-binding protein